MPYEEKPTIEDLLSEDKLKQVNTVVARPVYDLIKDHRSIDQMISSHGVKRKRKVDRIIESIYQSDAADLTPDERNAFYFLIPDVFQRYHDVKRDTGIPYINHPLDVAGIVSQLGDDFTTVVAALYHDAAEEYIATTIKKETKRKINEVREKKAMDRFGLSWKNLTHKNKNKIDLLESERNKIKEKVKKEVKKDERKLIYRYLENMREELEEGLITHGLNKDKALRLAIDVKETVEILTRSYFDNYYDALDNILSPKLQYPRAGRLRNKFRALKIKFADCIANTEVVEYEGYTLKDLVNAWIRAYEAEEKDPKPLEKLAALTEELSEKHRKGRKAKKKVTISGKKRVYRTFKDYFLVNAYRTYSQHIKISRILAEYKKSGIYHPLFRRGLLAEMRSLTREYRERKVIRKTQFDRVMDKYRKMCIRQSIDINEGEFTNFIGLCARSGYFVYAKNLGDVGRIFRGYMTESKDLEGEEKQLLIYQVALVKRTIKSADAIMNHLVSHHSKPPLTPLKIMELLALNDQYKEDRGYGFVTMPARDEADKQTKGSARKTLLTPDGIIHEFIDGKIRVGPETLDDLYHNKVNMFMVALSAKTLGYMYLDDIRHILTGLDLRGGISPSEAIGTKAGNGHSENDNTKYDI